ncbi:hypothetical protein [Sphingopyxis macrogoltabida]|uniref:Uncharacterized protein n=1 Tax=Sphingopyxis macrogoltabida TaxID=33050 RepID=A0A0P0DVC0_SPHMC|nr:hypothetical protein [Sphingopyxis macrogoltabida]ALJ12653.1 hypothetical protein LH19_07215 [Sphingopyxis macrogoltabida]ALJ14140.1 hypothetical protein LH19_14800 [Sphingopyxis macrogoltabida]AMU89879.1 hypothetical protein ATM17_12620 [Sphingopyxis macrogoltabida]AMU90406.1 hypothetical protein ATM17_15375 [Sphingopyxis macrogoltabida]
MTNRTPVEQIERTRNILAFLLVGAFVAVIPFLLFKVIPEKNEQIITYMVGQLSGMAVMALGFYFVNKVGQDAIDATKAENSRKFADAVVAVAQATGSSTPEPDVILRPGETAQAEEPKS